MVNLRENRKNGKGRIGLSSNSQFQQATGTRKTTNFTNSCFGNPDFTSSFFLAAENRKAEQEGKGEIRITLYCLWRSWLNFFVCILFVENHDIP
jgi:hypothetical protein